MRRRDFIKIVAGSTVAWPLAARAQQSSTPVVAFINGRSSEASVTVVAAFRKGLGKTGYVEGQSVTVEYNYLEGQYDRLPALLSDLIRRHVAVIATPGSIPASLAAKTATATIPIVFGVGSDPVKLGLVTSLAQPGGNATGINYFANETAAKRLRLLHDLVPKAVRIVVLVNPVNVQATKSTLQAVQESAVALGLQIHILNASTIGEIDEAFDIFTRERPDALFVAPDAFLNTRRGQFATLTARANLPATFDDNEDVEAGGLMSYGTDKADMFHQVGIYTGNILKGAKPSELPVVQSTRFVFAINMQTARALGVVVPPDVLSIADEVIE